MKNLIYLFIFTGLIFSQSCSNTPEAPPSEQSIESVSTVSSSSSKGDKVLLRIKPKVGTEQNMTMEVKTIIEGMEEADVNMVMKTLVKVVNQKDDIFTYEINYKSAKMSMEMGGLSFSFDSEDENPSGMGAMIGEQLMGILNKKVTLEITDRGRVVSIDMPGNITSEQIGDVGSIAIPLPDDPVGIGDSWTSGRDMDGMGDMNMTMEVTKITVGEVEVKTTGTIEGDSEDEAGNFSGKYTLDRDTGFTKKGVMNMDVMAEGQKIKMEINFKSL